MKTKIIRTVAFFLIITVIPALTLFSKKETVSYNENKVLAEFPEFNFDNYKSRSFMKGVSSYFSDHFVLRERFIKLKNALDKAIGKDEINGVIEVDGSLIQVFRNTEPKTTERNIAALNKLKAKHSEIPFYFLLAPTAQEKFKSSLPTYLDESDENGYISECFKKLDGIESIDVFKAVTETPYAFYRTDHHWTAECAYAAYAEAGKSLGYDPLPESFFDIQTVSSDFKGTLYSKTLNEKITADEIKACRNGSSFTLTVPDKTYNSLYFDKFLCEKDKYLYFLGGNYGVCTVKNNSLNSGKKLLLIKDSYANSFIPFIAEHYSCITVIDPRYCSVKQLSAVNPSDFDAVLILFNALGFSQEQSFTIIEFLGENR